MRVIAVLVFFIPWSVYAADASLEQKCLAAGGKVTQSEIEMSTHQGSVNGLSQQYCFIEKDNRSMMIGLKTLGSARPSIAATYLLKGLDMNALPKTKELNPAIGVCRNLGGASINFYTSGGVINKYGQSGMCVFGDGSKVSPWSLIYVSIEKNYMDLRKHIISKPLSLNLPYINR